MYAQKFIDRGKVPALNFYNIVKFYMQIVTWKLYQ